jgi:broad specificity phosphatase PhoE
MPRLYLVRHGKAAAGYGDDVDPGLDEEGRRQADAAAERLAGLGPLPIITSPLRRTRETAAALERRWNTMAVVDPAVAEIPSPSEDLAARHQWLQGALASTYDELGPRYSSWRTMVTELLLRLRDDTVIVTHFVAINAAIGIATGDDRVMCHPVSNASISVFDHDHQSLTFVGTDLPDIGADRSDIR